MANMYIEEFANVARDNDGQIIPVGRMPSLTSQKVAYTTSSASAAFQTGTTLVRITCDAEAWLSFGANPTATVSSMNMQASTPEYFGVKADGTLKVAAYDGVS